MKNISIVALLVAFPLAAGAVSLKEKRERKKAELALAEEMEIKECSPIDSKIDWKTWAKAPKGVSISGYCDVSYAVRSICKEYGKDAVKGIKKFSCAYKDFPKGTSSRDQFAFSLKGGTLKMSINRDSANKDDAVKKWLEENLE